MESAKYLIQTGDFNSAKRLIERLNKRAGKTLQGYQKTIARLLAECWHSARGLKTVCQH